MPRITPFRGLVPVGAPSQIEQSSEHTPEGPRPGAGNWVVDSGPAFYACRVDYRSEAGLEKTRTALVARVDPFATERKDVLPAVEAAPGGVEAALKELKRHGCKKVPVVAFYEDPQFEVERILSRSQAASVAVARSPGVTRRLWRINAARDISLLQNFFQVRECVLVDGIEYFRACRRLRESLRRTHPETEDEQFWPLLYLVNLYDFGVTLGSYQYLVPAENSFDLNKFVFEANSFFEVQTFPWRDAETRRKARTKLEEELRSRSIGRVAVGAAFRGEPQFFLFILKENVDRSLLLPPEISPRLYNTAVVFLRTLFVEKWYWRGGDPEERWPLVTAVHTIAEALHRLEEQNYGACFFHAPPLKREVFNLALRNVRLPAYSIRLTPPAAPPLADKLPVELSASKQS